MPQRIRKVARPPARQAGARERRNMHRVKERSESTLESAIESAQTSADNAQTSADAAQASADNAAQRSWMKI